MAHKLENFVLIKVDILEKSTVETIAARRQEMFDLRAH